MEYKKGFLAEQWHKYRRKKTIFGIAFDFLFTTLLIAMLFPQSRRVVSATIIRYSMFQPKESSEVIYLSENQMDWYLEDLDGNQVSFSEFKGKPIFLNFWATWCPPCLAEMPSIQRLYNEYNNRMAFVLISSEKTDVLKEFIQEENYTMPIYHLKSDLPDVLSSRSIPASFLITPEGKIVMKKQGAAKWDGKSVKSTIDEMLVE